MNPSPAAVLSNNLEAGNSSPNAAVDSDQRLRGKRAAVLLYSHYPSDPRPRRAAEALAREGVSLEVICLQANDLEPRSENINGINVFRVPMKRRRGGKVSYLSQYALFILISFFLLTVRSLKRRYHIVHVHNMPDVLVFSALFPKILGATIILDLHDPMPELMVTIFGLSEHSFAVGMLKRFEKWSIRFADVVLTVNQACKDIFSARSCASEKISVVFNSPDEQIFQFHPAELKGLNAQGRTGPFLILYHGSLVPRNGFDLAVDALEIVRKQVPAAKLLVYGERTPFFDEVMESAQTRGLTEALEYGGRANLNQIVGAIERCDIGIIPNHRNLFTEINTPTRIFEYLALGKPVIAPRSKGIRDYFGEADLVFFELGDAGDLATQILYAYSHPSEVEQTLLRGQQVYLAHTWTKERLNLLNPIRAQL